MAAEQEYAGWVAPIARVLADDHRALLSFVRATPVDAWERPSGVVEGWSCRDILAHLSGGNDQLLQIVLRAVVSNKPLGPETFDIDTDAANESGVRARRSWTLGQLIAELDERGTEVTSLLAELRDDDERRRIGEFTLGGFLRLVAAERHDHEHLAQLRTAVA